MQISLLAMFIPVIVIVLVMKHLFNRTITWGEAAIQFGIALLIVTATYYVGLSSRMRDRQFLNGVVTNKEQVWTSCDHSYRCNCTKDAQGHESCSTCYEHSNDWDWTVFTNAGKRNESKFTISRIDRRGSYEPPRWTRVEIGETVALSRSFSNYVMAAPDSLFHRIARNHKLPAYPKGYDYSHADRVIADGITIPDLADWNRDLDAMLAQIGPIKQANAVVVITKASSPQYGEDLRNLWLGGKKNDTIVVIGAPAYPAIAWVNVFSWSKREMLNVALRNDIVDLKTASRTTVLPVIRRNIVENFERRPMAEYAYLRDNIEPTPTFLIVGWLLAILAPLGLGYFFHRHFD